MNPIILVSGSRDFADPAALYAVLHELKPASIHVGDARGADAYAAEYCREMNVECFRFRADWDKYGKRAGPIRNGIMVKDWLEISQPERRVAIFCWIDGPCKGTRDCYTRVKDVNYMTMRIIHVGPVPGDLK